MPANLIADLTRQGGELIRLPSGMGVWYFDDDHSYWRFKKEDGGRGKRLTGVTTAIKPIDFRPDGLMKWAAKLNTVGVARLVDAALEADDVDQIRSELAWLTDENTEQIWGELTTAGLTYEDIREEAATRGTNVHELALRALAMGEEVPDLSALTPEERGYARGVMKFWLDHRPEPLEVEQIVADNELGVAGRFDLRAELSICGHEQCPCRFGGIGLIDLKTGRYSSAGHHIQVALYDYLAEACGVGASDYTAVLYARENGSYRCYEGLATVEQALDTVLLYRHAGVLNNAAKKQRDSDG